MVGAHVFAAVILESCAFLPVCLSPLWVSARNLSVSRTQKDGYRSWSEGNYVLERTHNQHRGLHLEGVTGRSPKTCLKVIRSEGRRLILK